MATAMTLLNSCVFLLFPLSLCLTPPLFSLVCRSGRGFPPLHTCAITSPVAYHLISLCFKTLVSPPSIVRLFCQPVALCSRRLSLCLVLFFALLVYLVLLCLDCLSATSTTTSQKRSQNTGSAATNSGPSSASALLTSVFSCHSTTLYTACSPLPLASTYHSPFIDFSFFLILGQSQIMTKYNRLY